MLQLPENEKWISGYEGVYSVNTDGDIISYKKEKRLKLKGAVLPGRNEGEKTYRVITLSVNGFQYFLYYHRIVAETFIPNPENKPQVNHKDGNKLNNRMDNLEWVTHKENMRHAWDMGLSSVEKNCRPVEWGKYSRDEVIYHFINTGECLVKTDKTLIDHISDEDLINNGIHPNMINVHKSTKSIKDEWCYRYSVVSLILKGYSLSQLSKLTGLNISILSKVRAKLRWQDFWQMYEEVKDDLHYNPIY